MTTDHLQHIPLSCSRSFVIARRTALSPPLAMTSPSRLLSCAAVLVLCLLSLLSSTSADYAVSSLQETAYGWEGQLKMTTPGPYGDDIPTLSLSVWFETNARLRVTLRDATAKRWEIPPSFLSIPSTTPPTRAPMQALYSFNVTTNPFGFAITRRSTGRVLFNSSSLPLHYSDQFLQLGTTLHPNAPIYGLGERILPFRLPQEDMVIWDNDWGNPTLKNLVRNTTHAARRTTRSDCPSLPFSHLPLLCFRYGCV